MLMEIQTRKLISVKSVTNMQLTKSPKISLNPMFSIFVLQIEYHHIPTPMYIISDNKSRDCSDPCFLKPVLSKPVGKF